MTLFKHALNNGSLAMSAEFGVSNSRLTWSSSEAGYLQDFTGDGLPDRLVVANSNAYGNGALVVYPSRGCRAIGETARTPTICAWDRRPHVWMGRSLRAPNRFDIASPAATLIPNHDPDDATRGFEQLLTDLAVDFNGDGLTDLVGVRPELRLDDGQGSARLLQNPTVDWNYGAGFRWTGWQNVVGPTVGQIGSLAVTAVTAVTDPRTGARSAQTRHHWMDLNGDGLVDLISAEGWWLPNSGGVFAHVMRLDSPVHDVPWSEQGVMIDRPRSEAGGQARDHYSAKNQIIMDVNNDGRPDLVRLLPSPDSPNGFANTIQVYSDADMSAAPGRLRHIDNGHGHHVEFKYQTLTAALKNDPNNPPAKGWVVSEVRERASDGGAPEETVRIEDSGEMAPAGWVF